MQHAVVAVAAPVGATALTLAFSFLVVALIARRCRMRRRGAALLSRKAVQEAEMAQASIPMQLELDSAPAALSCSFALHFECSSFDSLVCLRPTACAYPMPAPAPRHNQPAPRSPCASPFCTRIQAALLRACSAAARDATGAPLKFRPVTARVEWLDACGKATRITSDAECRQLRERVGAVGIRVVEAADDDDAATVESRLHI